VLYFNSAINRICLNILYSIVFFIAHPHSLEGTLVLRPYRQDLDVQHLRQICKTYTSLQHNSL